ncbi:MAG: universal stress protein [Acidimicrobiales bacterium]
MAPDPEPTTANSTPAPPRGDGEPVRGRIVVGVDDSEQAAAALRWALEEGVLRQATVEVVHAWSPPVSALPFGATFRIPVDEGEIDSAARASVDEVVDAALAEMDERPPEVLRTILPGGAAMTLIDVSAGGRRDQGVAGGCRAGVGETADLLVVGSHGRTGLSRLVLGSVAMACVQHAPCPVVVVRTPSEG